MPLAQRLYKVIQPKAPESIFGHEDEQFTLFYSRKVRALAAKYLPESDVDDLVQEVWLSFTDHVEQMTEIPAQGQRRWLETVVRNKAIDALRKRSRQKTGSIEELTSANKEPAAPDAEAHELLMLRWKLAGVRAVLEQLRPQLTETNYGIIRSLFFDGRTPRELAAQLHMTEKMIHDRRAWALKKLKPHLRVYSGEDAEDS